MPHGNGRAGTAERAVLRAVRRAMSASGAFAGVDTFKRKTTLMGKLSVKFDFFANGGLVFADGLCDGRFGRAIDNTGEDDTALL